MKMKRQIILLLAASLALLVSCTEKLSFDIVTEGAVDMGTSVKWAAFNLGATAPEEAGDYYAWGETAPKEDYSEESYTYKDNPTVLPLSNDAANVRLGGNWRMPTAAEIQELADNCKAYWTKLNDIEGVVFTSKKTGKSIFIPAAGWMDGTSKADESDYMGYCLSSSAHSSYPDDASVMVFFHNPDQGRSDKRHPAVIHPDLNCDRYSGFPVRPVFAEKFE